MQMVDHTLLDVPLASAYLDSLYNRGYCRVMCASLPIYSVVTSNVRGVRQMLPDPNWKAEDQPGDQARTSGSKNNEDDDLGGDMPSWISKEESN